MIDNLIHNACRYAKSIVTIECLWTDTEFCFRVADDGVGIVADQYEEIIKPFYRAKNQLVKKSGGSGLGLAIVRRIVNLHNGCIKASGWCIIFN